MAPATAPLAALGPPGAEVPPPLRRGGDERHGPARGRQPKAGRLTRLPMDTGIQLIHTPAVQEMAWDGARPAATASRPARASASASS